MERPDHPEDLVRLVSRAREGDGQALEQLLAAIHVHLRRYIEHWIRRRPGWQDTVEDLAQDSLIKIAYGLGRCDAANDTALLEWCRTIAVNTGTDYLRKMREEWTARSFVENLDELFVLDSDVRERDIIDESAPQIMLRILQEAHEKEPDEVQVLLWLRIVEGNGWGDAASLVGLPGTAAKRRFQRTQARLRRAVLEKLIGLKPDELSVVRRWMTRLDVAIKENSPTTKLDRTD